MFHAHLGHLRWEKKTTKEERRGETQQTISLELMPAHLTEAAADDIVMHNESVMDVMGWWQWV